MTQRESMPMWFGHHVAGEADAVRPGTVTEVRVGGFATEVLGDVVVVERVRGGDRVGVAAHPLDPFGRRRAFPQADEPQPGHAPAREGRELLVRDAIERPDLAPMCPRQLVEPDVRALGHQHDLRHPGRVGRERLGFLGGRPERRRLGRAPPPPPPPPPPKRRWSARSSSARTPRARSKRAMRSSRLEPRIEPHRARTKRSCAASEVGACRAGIRISSMSDPVSPSMLGPAAKTPSRSVIASA